MPNQQLPMEWESGELDALAIRLWSLTPRCLLKGCQMQFLPHPAFKGKESGKESTPKQRAEFARESAKTRSLLYLPQRLIAA